MLHSANSSSCGRSQPVIMLSIGRREGIKNRSRVTSQRTDQEMVRRKALVGGGKGVALVQHHHLVQQRRAAPPMADDENRRILDLHLGQLATQNRLLQRPQRRIEQADGRQRECQRHLERMNPKSVLGQQPKPGSGQHAVPKPSRPKGIGIRDQFLLTFLCHGEPPAPIQNRNSEILSPRRAAPATPADEFRLPGLKNNNLAAFDATRAGRGPVSRADR